MLSFSIILIVFFFVTIEEIVMLDWALFADVCYGVTRRLNILIRIINIFINFFKLLLEFLFGGYYLLESFLFFAALLFKVCQLLETLFFILGLVAFGSDLYRRNLVVFLGDFLQGLLVCGNSILYYGPLIFLLTISMNLHQKIIIVIWRNFDLFERTAITL